jgi:hypothetical protein
MCSPEKKKYNENFEMKSKCSIKGKQQLLNILKQKVKEIEQSMEGYKKEIAVKQTEAMS